MNSVPRSMRDLLVLSLDYPPNDGGISRLAAGAVTALGRLGVRTRVVTFALNRQQGLARPSSPIAEVDCRKGRRDWQIFKEVRKHLRNRDRYAPILTTVWNPEATLAMLAGGLRVSILAHGNEVMPYSSNGVKAQLRRLILERAHAVICNSHFTATLVRQIAPRCRTTVLNPGIDADRFTLEISQNEARHRLGLPKPKQIILTVARLDPIKGHETVLHAMASLSPQELAGLFYVIIGKGENGGMLRALVRQLGLEEHVHFAGFVDDDNLPLWYRAADLFVLPSVVDLHRRGMEGFGIAFGEAQAAGLPVIGSRSGGIPDAVRHGEGGWLIPEADVWALANYLRELVSEPGIFAEQGLRARERIHREMNWESYARKLIETV